MCREPVHQVMSIHHQQVLTRYKPQGSPNTTETPGQQDPLHNIEPTDPLHSGSKTPNTTERLFVATSCLIVCPDVPALPSLWIIIYILCRIMQMYGYILWYVVTTCGISLKLGIQT